MKKKKKMADQETRKWKKAENCKSCDGELKQNFVDELKKKWNVGF